MKNIVNLIFLLILLNGCKCEGTFSTRTYLKNNSSGLINFKLFLNKKLVDQFSINNSSKLEIGSSSGRGLFKVITLDHIWKFQSDSIVIEFIDKSYIYKKRIDILGGGISYDDPRNFLNTVNYKEINTIKESKCSLITEAYFNFEDSMFK